MRSFIGFRAALVGGIFALLPAGAMAQNGLFNNPRVFNNFPTSTLVMTNSDTIPGSATISDSLAGSAASGANRDDILISNTGGASPQTLTAATSFTLSADVTLTDGSDAPRKETGLRINGAGADFGNDALFIVNSDAHEIVAFGGPFFSFASGPTGYQTGQTIFLQMQYDANAHTMTYSEDDGAGLQTSGPLSYTPVPQFQLGMYGQWAPNDNTDFINVAFTNINATESVPEPASLGLLSMGCVTLLGRRRKAKIA